MKLSWKEKDKRLVDGIEQLRKIAKDYGSEMLDIEQHYHDWNDPIEEENKVKIIKEYVIMFKNIAPLTIKADSFDLDMSNDMFVFYSEDGDEIAMFHANEITGVSLISQRAESEIGCIPPMPMISGPVA